MQTTLLKKRWWFFGLIVAFGFFIDQGSKYFAQKHLSSVYLVKQPVDIGGKTIAVIEERHRATNAIEALPNVLNFIYKENSAAAFSLTESWPDHVRKPFLLSLSFLSIIFFVVWFLKASSQWLLLCSLSLIIAGAFGNFFDRVFLGYVIDFIDVHGGFFGKPHLHFATFNIADSLICIGALGVLMRSRSPQTIPTEAMLSESDRHV